VIEYRGIHKSFDRPVLAGVDLEVATGEFLAIVGPSGCGKSVLLKMTIGLLQPDGGDVFIDGQSVFGADEGVLQELRSRVGYLFQSAALFDSLTVYDNVALGLHRPADRLLNAFAIRDHVVRALRDVNLDPQAVVGKLPAELSGGMRKRVGLARAVVGRPSILLYDEPVTGLDPVNAAAVAALVVQINKKLGATSVMVTHDVKGALAICDRIALLHGGRVRFVGTPAEFRQSSDLLVRAFTDRAAADRLSLRDLDREVPA
jgi:phospholipid/cholesterol/gamma-HCH transport system ATP-binding protein